MNTTSMSVVGANGEAVQCIGQKLVTIHHEGIQTDAMVYITKGSTSLMSASIAIELGFLPPTFPSTSAPSPPSQPTRICFPISSSPTTLTTKKSYPTKNWGTSKRFYLLPTAEPTGHSNMRTIELQWLPQKEVQKVCRPHRISTHLHSPSEEKESSE